jgi:cellulose synthase/poly-beta-1,6-N-acetylglucosamine synthase-like glycosyltransferase
LETELRDLLTRYEQLRVIEVPNSTSKADNLNFFLNLEIESDIIGIYDCKFGPWLLLIHFPVLTWLGDHYPHPYAPRWAAERFAQNLSVDIVQGRCVVFNARQNLLASLISIEFDKIYACAHPGRAAMVGFGLFAGSNGYWRTALLCEHNMDGSMLTEDIDSALRAFAKGWNAVHDLNVVSYELAPTSLKAFWRQRMRWAQGWTQASIRHLVLAWKKSPAERAKRSFSQRFGIFSLLLVREVSYYLVTQYTCLVFGFIITKFPHSPAELVKLIYFQYPVSQWCFFIR